MDIKEMVSRFLDCGISLRRIADTAQINKNTIVSLHNGGKITPKTESKIRSALRDIALELYTTAYSDEISDNEEWEE